MAGVGGVVALAGCPLQPDRDHNGLDAPRAGSLHKPVRTAWVFSLGGPRGFVHVGVIKALEELGLAPDLVVGCASAGALVGALYASGLRASALALDMQTMSLLQAAALRTLHAA